jgi:predicted amidophosphoribosyltransferase
MTPIATETCEIDKLDLGNGLVRERATVSQIGLTRPQPAENIRGAFRGVHPKKVVGRGILTF